MQSKCFPTFCFAQECYENNKTFTNPLTPQNFVTFNARNYFFFFSRRLKSITVPEQDILLCQVTVRAEWNGPDGAATPGNKFALRGQYSLVA
jgi:hypothetical protein